MTVLHNGAIFTKNVRRSKNGEQPLVFQKILELSFKVNIFSVRFKFNLQYIRHDRLHAGFPIRTISRIRHSLFKLKSTKQHMHGLCVLKGKPCRQQQHVIIVQKLNWKHWKLCKIQPLRTACMEVDCTGFLKS